MFQLMKLDCKA